MFSCGWWPGDIMITIPDIYTGKIFNTMLISMLINAPSSSLWNQNEYSDEAIGHIGI